MRTKLLCLFVVLALLAALMLNAPVHAQPGDFQATVVLTGTPSPTAAITPTSTLTATTTLTPTLSSVVASPTATLTPMATPTLFPLPPWTPLPIPTFSLQPVLPNFLVPCSVGCGPADPPSQFRDNSDKWQ